jgi:hypothetical protein
MTAAASDNDSYLALSLPFERLVRNGPLRDSRLQVGAGAERGSHAETKRLQYVSRAANAHSLHGVPCRDTLDSAAIAEPTTGNGTADQLVGHHGRRGTPATRTARIVAAPITTPRPSSYDAACPGRGSFSRPLPRAAQ